MVPVSAHVHFVLRDDHDMERAGRNRVIATGTEVLLDSLIGLDGSDRQPAKIAHAMTASMASTAMTTMAMSTADF